MFSSVTRPDILSNIRTVHYTLSASRSLARNQLEARRLRATALCHTFWAEHNADYNGKLQMLQSRHEKEDGTIEIPSEEMSAFYAQHLKSTRAKHKEFNRWWIMENFRLLSGGLKCWIIEQTPKRLRRESGYFSRHE